MNKIVITLAALLLAGCSDSVEQVTEPPVSEKCTIMTLTYTPSGHGSSSGVGISTSGSLVFGGGGVHIPERYGAVVRCGNENRALDLKKDVWTRLTEGGELYIVTQLSYTRHIETQKRYYPRTTTEIYPVE